MVRIQRRFLNEQQRLEYQQFLLTDPTDDQQLEYFRNQFENLTTREILDVFRILNQREHPSQIRNNNNRRNQNRLEQQRQQQNQIRNNMAAAVPPVEYIDDPFHGNINPGTKTGSQLYLKATASIPEEDKFDLNISSAQKFLDLIDQDADAFGWGELVRMIPVGLNQHRDLLVEHKMLLEEHLKRQAHITWQNSSLAQNAAIPDNYNVSTLDPANNPAHINPFYRRVKSRMIAKRILGRLKAADYKILKNKEGKYKWTGNGKVEYDGPTILWLLLQSCNPSTRVGVSELKTDLRQATSAKFKHNVKDLTDYMSSTYREITEKGQQHQDYLLDLFNALGTVSNSDFAAFVREERQSWEIGGAKDADQLIAEALTIYNNAVSANRWEYSDPKDAKILALTTKVDQLEAQMKLSANATTQKPPSQQTSSDNSNGNSKYLKIDDWRKKKGEPMIKKDGKTWYWCPKHVSRDGNYDGLYVTHKPEDHDEWAKNRNRFKKREKKDESYKQDENSNETPDNEKEKSLALSNSLKAALLTRCDLTAAQADALIKEAREEVDF